MKLAQKHPPRKDFVFSIIDYVKLHNYLPKHLGSQQKISYWVQRLKKEGLLYQNGRGIWYVDEEKAGVISSQNTPPTTPSQRLKIRGHGFAFKLQIPNLSNWLRRRAYLDKKEIPYSALQHGESLLIKNSKIFLYNSCIMVYFEEHKDFEEDTAQLCQDKAVYEFKEIITSLSNMLHTSFVIGKNLKFKICTEHYAEVGNGLAMLYSKNNDKLKVKDSKGDIWLLIDYSTGTAELETVSESSLNDMDNAVKPFFNDMRDYVQQTGEALKMTDMLKALSMLQSQTAMLSNIMGVSAQSQMEDKKNKKLNDYIG